MQKGGIKGVAVSLVLATGLLTTVVAQAQTTVGGIRWDGWWNGNPWQANISQYFNTSTNQIGNQSYKQRVPAWYGQTWNWDQTSPPPAIDATTSSSDMNMRKEMDSVKG